MPIREEPVRIEFQYERKDTDTGVGTFKVEYFLEKDGDEEKKYLNVTPLGSDEPHVFEVDFFVEVVDFLRRKGVVEEVQIESPKVENTGSTLPLPSIQVSGSAAPEPTSVMGYKDQLPINPIPVSSFVTHGNHNELSPPVIDSVMAPKIISASDEKTPLPVINRPVIRTRVEDNEDPMKALEEARRQRKVNSQKSIKRKEETEEIDEV